MKLRNKKTGETYESISYAPIDVYFFDKAGKDGITRRSYGSLAELCEEWEDYEPKEPLIKDEKIRKCAKLWLEINEIYSVTYHKRRGGGSYLELDNMPMRNGCCIIFQDLIDELEDGAIYSLDELCGAPEPLEPTFVDIDERIREKEEE